MNRYELHLPLSEKEAKKRAINSGFSKLLVILDQKSIAFDILSHFIFKAKTENRIFIAQTIICYEGTKKIKDKLDGADIEYWPDNEICDDIGKTNNFLMNCITEANVKWILKNIDSEAIVFYSIEKSNNNFPFNDGIIMASLDGYVEANFLNFVNESDYFTFFQSTHNSIEMLGKTKAILDYFINVCKPLIG